MRETRGKGGGRVEKEKEEEGDIGERRGEQEAKVGVKVRLNVSTSLMRRGRKPSYQGLV